MPRRVIIDFDVGEFACQVRALDQRFRTFPEAWSYLLSNGYEPEDQHKTYWVLIRP